jgi:replicative DNA helicase
MRPLRQGDFGIIAGRPDTGKTTFITSEMTFMASQLKKYYKEDDKIITWFNNEGQGKRIITRLYQSALNASISDLLDMKKAKVIVDRYREAIGHLDTIRIFDVHGLWNYDITDILEEVNSGLMIFDMIDNIKFHSNSGGMQSRTDQVLEAMYQWARVLGVRFDCPVLATSQISVDGDGMQFPTLSMLKDSKTGKQGACDFQLMIGAINELGMDQSRFMGLPKNKLQVEGFPKDPRCEVIFDGLRARYKTPTVM